MNISMDGIRKLDVSGSQCEFHSQYGCEDIMSWVLSFTYCESARWRSNSKLHYCEERFFSKL